MLMAVLHVVTSLLSSGFYQSGEGAVGLSLFQSHRIKLGIQVFVQSWFWLVNTRSDQLCEEKSIPLRRSANTRWTWWTGFVESDGVLSEVGLVPEWSMSVSCRLSKYFEYCLTYIYTFFFLSHVGWIIKLYPKILCLAMKISSKWHV